MPLVPSLDLTEIALFRNSDLEERLPGLIIGSEIAPGRVVGKRKQSVTSCLSFDEQGPGRKFIPEAFRAFLALARYPAPQLRSS